MASRVQAVVLLMGQFTVLEHLEWTGTELPLILNYLLSFSIRAALHDIASIFLSLGIVLNNLLNSGLVRLIHRRRPAPYTDPGQPAREMQSILFMVSFYVVYVLWWPMALNLLSSLSLVVVVSWAWLALDLGGHYFTSQLLGGLYVGAVAGLAWGWVFHAWVLPRAPPWVCWWNARAPACLNVTHANHYHPRRPCYDPRCTGYSICEPPRKAAASELGFGNLSTTLLRLILIALIHM